MVAKHNPVLCVVTHNPVMCVVTHNPVLCVVTHNPVLCVVTHNPVMCVVTHNPVLHKNIVRSAGYTTYLAQLVWFGCYERVCIVDRVMGGDRRIEPTGFYSGHFAEYTAMNLALAAKTQAIARIIATIVPTLPPLCTLLCTSYLDYKVCTDTLGWIGDRYRPQHFATTNTLLIVHGVWPVITEGETVIRKMYPRLNHVMIVSVDALDLKVGAHNTTDFSSTITDEEAKQSAAQFQALMDASYPTCP
jgi:hypothetical protein